MRSMIRAAIAAATLAVVATAQRSGDRVGPASRSGTIPTPVPSCRAASCARAMRSSSAKDRPSAAGGAERRAPRRHAARRRSRPASTRSAGFDIDGAGNLYVVDNCFGADWLRQSHDGRHASTRSRTRRRARPRPRPRGERAPAVRHLRDAAGRARGRAWRRARRRRASASGAGRVVKIVEPSTVTNLVTGLDFLRRLSRPTAATLFVGNLDGSFVGVGQEVRARDGHARSARSIGGLSGSYGRRPRRRRATSLVTGGFTSDFSSSTVEAVNARGTTTERGARLHASRATSAFDAARGQALVLDFAAVAGHGHLRRCDRRRRLRRRRRTDPAADRQGEGQARRAS